MSSALKELEQLKALADEQRLYILKNIIRKHEISVTDICDCCGLKQSKISYHLKILLDANLITKRSDKTTNFYSINMKELDKILNIKAIYKLFYLEETNMKCENENCCQQEEVKEENKNCCCEECCQGENCNKEDCEKCCKCCKDCCKDGKCTKENNDCCKNGKCCCKK